MGEARSEVELPVKSRRGSRARVLRDGKERDKLVAANSVDFLPWQSAMSSSQGWKGQGH